MRKMERILFAVVVMLVVGSAVFAGGNRAAAAGDAAVYRRLYAAEVSTFNYLVSTNANDMQITANLVDTLVEYDKYGVVKPALAQSWEHNADYTVWTFKIRPGVKWVDYTGKEVAEVTAADWVAGVRYVSEAANDSDIQYMLDGFVKNAADYYSQSADRLAAESAVAGGEYRTVADYYAAEGINPAGLSLRPEDIGVRAVDTYTLQYTLESPCIFFLSLLSYGSYSPVYGPLADQWGANLGQDNRSLYYNGAYILSSFKPQQERILTKNASYWDKDNVFINRIEWTYNAEAARLAPTMFTRGEVDYAEISTDILNQWLTGADTRDLVRNSPPDRSYSYFYAFNFEPRFDAAYEPDNWLIAVNNENFRLSLMKGLDRLKALAVQDPDDPASLRNNTVTPAEFAVGAGRDFVQYPAIKAVNDGDSFNEREALAYKERAVAELRAAGATFPIKILMPYNAATTNWDLECQVVEQQLEALLGRDYIDIVVEAGPVSGFLAAVRRSGKYAFMKCNWGADYADPQTWTDPFTPTGTYNFMAQNASRAVDGKPASNKTAATTAVVNQYYALVDRAKGVTNNEAQRYTAFAEAEAFLINHAFIVPFSIDTYGYVAARLNPFESQYAPYGLPNHRFKGMKIMAKPMGNAEFKTAYAAWQRERAAALAAAQ
jgi:oligopeptide transport system substrate-binding protein